MTSVSAFDLDHTLIKSNSSFLFYHHLIRKGFFSSFSLIKACMYKYRYHLFSTPLLDLHQKIFRRFLLGKPLKLIEDEVRSFLNSNFYLNLYMPVFSRLRLAQHEGEHTVIISSSPSFLVKPIANYLGCSGWHSSDYLTDEKGVFKEIGLVLLGEGKASHLQKIMKKLKIKRDKVTAYSDSMVDLPLLYAAGKAVVVNPQGRLKKISREERWEEI